MADYERRVRVTLTAAEAEALDVAIQDMEGSYGTGFDIPATEMAALRRAKSKLDTARSLAARRNAEKRQAKADAR